MNNKIGEDNVGFQILKKMGWSDSEGIGKHKQGRKEPVSVTVRSRADLQQHTGLGHKICPISFSDKDYMNNNFCWEHDSGENELCSKSVNKGVGEVLLQFCKSNKFEPVFTYLPSSEDESVGVCSLKITLNTTTELLSQVSGPIGGKKSRKRLRDRSTIELVKSIRKSPKVLDIINKCTNSAELFSLAEESTGSSNKDWKVFLKKICEMKPQFTFSKHGNHKVSCEIIVKLTNTVTQCRHLRSTGTGKSKKISENKAFQGLIHKTNHDPDVCFGRRWNPMKKDDIESFRCELLSKYNPKITFKDAEVPDYVCTMRFIYKDKDITASGSGSPKENAKKNAVLASMKQFTELELDEIYNKCYSKNNTTKPGYE